MKIEIQHKKRAKRIIIKAIAIVAVSCLALLLMAPYIALTIFVNRHVDYRGYATRNYPMQDIY